MNIFPVLVSYLQGRLLLPIGHIQPTSRSLARLIAQFKATTTRRINELRNTPQQPIWQRGYHDRIIRNEVELDRYRKYIRNNPREAEKKAKHTTSYPRERLCSVPVFGHRAGYALDEAKEGFGSGRF